MWLLLALVVVSSAVTCTKEEAVTCILNHVDSNHDNIITVGELDNFIMEHDCDIDTSQASGLSIIEFCDFNKDGVLTGPEDVLGDGKPCLHSLGLRKQVCRLCGECNATFAKREYSSKDA